MKPKVNDIESDEFLINLYHETNDIKIREKIIHRNINLVKKIINSYYYDNKSIYDDLIQVGSIALITAIERFDCNLNTNFKTYASKLIIGGIKHYLRDQNSLIKFPREIIELLPKIRLIKKELRLKLNREPSIKEIAKELNITSKKIEEALYIENNFNCISLEQELENNSYILQIEDKKYKSFHLAEEDRIVLEEALKKLKSNYRKIIDFIFYQDLTQTEVAKKLGISQVQVSRNLKKALNELWNILNKRITPW